MSDLAMITKGTPQGSVMGPFMYNIFTNDLLLMMEKVQNCSIFNYKYADDNIHSTFEDVETILKQSCNVMINWFNDSLMQTNPAKFQCIFFGSKHKETLRLSENIALDVVDCVKLLGVDIDLNLYFNSHITSICKKVGKHIQVLRRLSSVLTSETKLLLFKSYVLSQFNFCSTVCHFCSLSDIRKVVKIQEHSLRIVYSYLTSSYSYLLVKSGMPYLYVNRLWQLMLQIYESLSSPSVPNYIKQIFEAKNRT